MVRKISVMICFVMAVSIFSLSLVMAEDGDDFEFHPRLDFTGTPDKIYIVRFTDAITAKRLYSVPLEIGQSGKGEGQFGTNSKMVSAVVFEIKNRTDFLDPQNIVSEKNIGTFTTDELILINIITGMNNALTFEGEEGTAPINYTPEVVAPVNEVVEVVNETAEVIVEEDSGITGKAISNLKFSPTLIYAGVGLVVVAGFVLFFMFGKHKGHSIESSEPQEPKTVKLSELKSRTNADKMSSAEQRLARAEQELRSARNELNNLKSSKSELSDAEEQFKKAKEKLDSLRALDNQNKPDGQPSQ